MQLLQNFFESLRDWQAEVCGVFKNAETFVGEKEENHGRAQHAGLHRSLADALGLEPATVMLLSTKEYKKTSMTFFVESKQAVRPVT